MRLLDDTACAAVEAAARDAAVHVVRHPEVWERFDFMDGVVGAGLFVGALRARFGGEYDALADEVLARAVELFNARGAVPGLHSGVAGLGLLLALEHDEAELADSIDEALLTQVRTPRLHTSLREGLGGIALYAALRGPALRDAVADGLAARAVHRPEGCAWPLPRRYAEARTVKVRGEPVLEVNAAHGLGSLLVGLAALARAGSATARQLIAPAVSWLWSFERQDGLRFARIQFGWAGEHGAEDLDPHTWCTGDLGVMRGAFLAADEAGLGAHRERALELARGCAKAIIAGAPVGLPGRLDLCCGASAVGQLLHRFAVDTGEACFLEAARATFAPLGAGLGGVEFRGFQFGRLGVLTALLSATHDGPMSWDLFQAMSLQGVPRR